MSPQHQQMLNKAARLARSGQRKEARQLIIRVLREDADSVAAWWGLANITGGVEERRRALKEILQREPEHEQAEGMLQRLEKRYGSEVGFEELPLDPEIDTQPRLEDPGAPETNTFRVPPRPQSEPVRLSVEAAGPPARAAALPDPLWDAPARRQTAQARHGFNWPALLISFFVTGLLLAGSVALMFLIMMINSEAYADYVIYTCFNQPGLSDLYTCFEEQLNILLYMQSAFIVVSAVISPLPGGLLTRVTSRPARGAAAAGALAAALPVTAVLAVVYLLLGPTMTIVLPLTNRLFSYFDTVMPFSPSGGLLAIFIAFCSVVPLAGLLAFIFAASRGRGGSAAPQPVRAAASRPAPVHDPLQDAPVRPRTEPRPGRRFNWQALLISFFTTGSVFFCSTFVIGFALGLMYPRGFSSYSEMHTVTLANLCFTAGAVIFTGLLAGGLTRLVGGPARIEAGGGALLASACNSLPALPFNDWSALSYVGLDVVMLASIFCVLPLAGALFAFIAAPSKPRLPRTMQAAVLPI